MVIYYIKNNMRREVDFIARQKLYRYLYHV